MSSDSEDDCYGNIAQKLQFMKNKYSDDKIQTNSLLDYSQKDTPKAVTSVAETIENNTEIACEEIKDNSGCEEIKDDSDCEELSLDSIIAQNSKNKATRRSKRFAAISTDNVLTTRTRKRLRTSVNSNESIASINSVVTQQNVSEFFADTSDIQENTSLGARRKSRGRGRPKGLTQQNVSEFFADTSDVQENTSLYERRKSRGRGRPKGRRGGYGTYTTTTNSNTLNNSSISIVNNVTETSSLRNSPNATRGRPRRNGRLSSNSSRRGQPTIGRNNHRGITRSYPTYSVGNTDEYPDESYNQPLFSKKNESKKEVVTVGEDYPELNDSLDENEELSVKVFWQNHECVKFKIRRFQKLRSIFDFFADRENVSHDKLFFTYNDKILIPEDTPDSITYSIVKFIDGGIINQSVSTLVSKDNQIAKDGIKLKFQCQNLKKPYETYIRLEDSLAKAMVQCAEHLEKPLDKLKFLFDGDIITGTETVEELELEGGECIDVKIIS